MKKGVMYVVFLIEFDINFNMWKKYERKLILEHVYMEGKVKIHWKEWENSIHPRFECAELPVMFLVYSSTKQGKFGNDHIRTFARYNSARSYHWELLYIKDVCFFQGRTFL